MDSAINFYELRMELEALGFRQPELLDDLRQKIGSEDDRFSINAEEHLAGKNLTFSFDIELAGDGRRSLTGYSGKIEEAHGSHESRFQLFEPEVTAKVATQMILVKLHLPESWDTSEAIPYTAAQVEAYLQKHNDLFINKNQNLKIMNDQNLSYLQKQLLNLGFGESMNKDLEKQIKAKTPEFTLSATQEYNQQQVAYQLHYKAGEQNDMYFFNKYDAALQSKEMAQTFYINKGSGITAKEAYNLLEGRAVHKELENKDGEKYKAWITLDHGNKTENGNFKLNTFSEGWNYKPERAIDKMDIVGINEEGAREKLMKSLEKGNRHQVTAMKNGKEVKLWLEANPAEHRVNLTNYKGEAQQLEHYKKPELKAEAKKDQKQAQGQEAAPEKKQSRNRGKKMAV